MKQLDDFGEAKAISNKPNILMFHVDNISVGDFGCYGGAYPLGAKTPNIDRFASESLMLTNYNVEVQCTPSRSALMTGRHPVRTGCITALPGSGLVAWEVTIADKLKELGYGNACYGKWHCGEDVGRLPADKGFDYWYGLHGTWDVALWPEDKSVEVVLRVDRTRLVAEVVPLAARVADQHDSGVPRGLYPARPGSESVEA